MIFVKLSQFAIYHAIFLIGHQVRLRGVFKLSYPIISCRLFDQFMLLFVGIGST